MTEVRVIRSGESWCVIDAGGTVIEDGLNNAAAWRIADRRNREVASPAEMRTDFAWIKRCEE